MPVGTLGRVCAVVVLYNPSPGIDQRIAGIRCQVDRVVVVDNGSDPESRARISDLNDESEGAVVQIANRENVGLAAAQNQGIAHAIKGGFDWVLLLDDDSVPDERMVVAFEATYRAMGLPPDLALLAPTFAFSGIATKPRYVVSRGRFHCRYTTAWSGPVLEDALFAIASGSLIRVAALEAVGAMRADFFIDYVDVEFGLRLRKAGWRIVVVSEARLDHRLGGQRERRLAGSTFFTTNHSAARRFTIYRNRARVWKAYISSFPVWCLYDIVRSGLGLVRILVFEEDRLSKLSRAVAGLYSGLRMPG